MDRNFNFYQHESSVPSTSAVNSSEQEMELNTESFTTGLPDTTISSVIPITTEQLTMQTDSGEDTYDLITASPSGSSDGSSNGFVKVEHGDLEQSVGLVGSTMSFRMLQIRDDGDGERRRRDQRYTVETTMDHELGPEESYTGSLSKAVEFAESAAETVSDAAITGEIMDAAKKVVNDTGTVKEILDDTVHLLGDNLKEIAGKAGDVAHQTTKDANIISGKVPDMSNATQKIGSVGADVIQLLGEDVNKATHTFKKEFDNVTVAAAEAVRVTEDSLASLSQEMKKRAGVEPSAATKPIGEDLIRLTDEINSQKNDGGRRANGAQQSVDYLSQQKSRNWGNYVGDAVGINAADDSSAEESMFDRERPLTIPNKVPKNMQLDRDFDSLRQGGFEVSPRPPTPPKELDDEDVKPTTIDLGQTAGRLSASGEHPSSILKNSAEGVKFNFKDMDARFLYIIYWRDPKKSGAVLGIALLTLLVLAKFPLIAVISYAGLSVLGGTLCFRIYKLIEAQIRKTDSISANPYQAYLENSEFHLPKEKVRQQVDQLIEHVNFIVNKLRRLFLVENTADSVKFGLLLWALTYVSCWFSGLSVLILAVLAVFTIPKVYEVYHDPIDRNVSIAKQHIDGMNKLIGEKAPFLKSATAEHEISHEKSH